MFQVDCGWHRRTLQGLLLYRDDAGENGMGMGLGMIAAKKTSMYISTCPEDHLYRMPTCLFQSPLWSGAWDRIGIGA